MTKSKKNRINTIPTKLIAPCGMNCRLCRAYLRAKKPCPGCRGDDRLKAKSCAECKIKNCKRIANSNIRYCYDCGTFPCEKLNHLDHRYRTKYGMSMIENLGNIMKFGIRQFIQDEKEKWACPECGELICVHQPQCLSCEYNWRKNGVAENSIPERVALYNVT